MYKKKHEVIHGFSPSVAPLFRETLEPNYEIQEGKRSPPFQLRPCRLWITRARLIFFIFLTLSTLSTVRIIGEQRGGGMVLRLPPFLVHLVKHFTKRPNFHQYSPPSFWVSLYAPGSLIIPVSIFYVKLTVHLRALKARNILGVQSLIAREEKLSFLGVM